jgi:hypothetical protein
MGQFGRLYQAEGIKMNSQFQYYMDLVVVECLKRRVDK